MLLLTILKSLVQPHLDYCSLLWSPDTQGKINAIEKVQKNLLSKIQDRRLKDTSYWEKLQTLGLYSQERRCERHMIVFLWKISQGLVAGYDMMFSDKSNRTGRKAQPATVKRSASAAVRNARTASITVKGHSSSTWCLPPSETVTMVTSICLRTTWITIFRIFRTSQPLQAWAEQRPQIAWFIKFHSTRQVFRSLTQHLCC